jgi:hypothetical protein
MIKEITKAIKFVNIKLDGTEKTAREAQTKLYGGALYRKDLNKQQENLVTCLIEGHGNYYNPDRVMNGKVKRFQGDTPKARLLACLNDLYQTT